MLQVFSSLDKFASIKHMFDAEGRAIGQCSDASDWHTFSEHHRIFRGMKCLQWFLKRIIDDANLVTLRI